MSTPQTEAYHRAWELAASHPKTTGAFVVAVITTGCAVVKFIWDWLDRKEKKAQTEKENEILRVSDKMDALDKQFKTKYGIGTKIIESHVYVKELGENESVVQEVMKIRERGAPPQLYSQRLVGRFTKHSPTSLN